MSNEREKLTDALNATERLRAQARQQQSWYLYGTCCKELAELAGKLDDLDRLQNTVPYSKPLPHIEPLNSLMSAEELKMRLGR